MKMSRKICSLDNDDDDDEEDDDDEDDNDDDDEGADDDDDDDDEEGADDDDGACEGSSFISIPFSIDAVSGTDTLVTIGSSVSILSVEELPPLFSSSFATNSTATPPTPTPIPNSTEGCDVTKFPNAPDEDEDETAVPVPVPVPFPIPVSDPTPVSLFPVVGARTTFNNRSLTVDA